MRRTTRDLLHDPTWLLIPVYPDEVSFGTLRRSAGLTFRELHKMVANLPARTPLAERTVGGETLYCWPTLDDKRRTLGDVWAVGS